MTSSWRLINRRSSMREQILDELIQMDTWDWWKSLIYELRERKDYAEAEAVFNEFKLNDRR
jgi:hypothetical protein